MKVLLLTDRPQLFEAALAVSGDDYVTSMGTPDTWPTDIDFIVSYGYRHIIREPYLSRFDERMINIHMSLLPHNRGADPNFWSWHDDTPKGVSIHLIDKGLDTGDLIMQMGVTKWHEHETLRSSYDFLQNCASRLFFLEWPRFRTGAWFILPKEGGGSFHKASERVAIFDQFPLGWDTPVAAVQQAGEKARRTLQ